MMRCLLKREGGFTLIELLASMAIGAIVLAAVTTTFISQTRSYDVQEQINGMHQSARATMDMITREARMAGYNTNDTYNFVGMEANASQLRIRANLNADNDTDDTNEYIIYEYDATNELIERTTSGVTETFVDHIDVFTFRYFDEDGNITATPADIRQVEITITAETAKLDPNYNLNGGFRTYTLSSLVTPRNLAY